MAIKECTLNGKKGYCQEDNNGNQGVCYTYNSDDWVGQNEALAKAQHDILRAKQTTSQP